MTGKPGVLQSMGLQRVGYHLVTEHLSNRSLDLPMISSNLVIGSYSYLNCHSFITYSRIYFYFGSVLKIREDMYLYTLGLHISNAEIC